MQLGCATETRKPVNIDMCRETVCEGTLSDSQQQLSWLIDRFYG
jgi:hypothetical protein